MASSLEFYLVNRTNLKFLIFDTLDPAIIVRLGKISTVMRGVVESYFHENWNIKTFFHQYMCNYPPFCTLMGIHAALAFGPAVVHFFNRSTSTSYPLDICVGFGGIESLGFALVERGYVYDPRPHDPRTFREAIHRYICGFTIPKLVVLGEKNPSPVDRQSEEFVFRRMVHSGSAIFVQAIVLHLVRCTPYEHILSLSSSKCRELQPS